MTGSRLSLVALRTAIGAGAWFAPERTMSVFGLEPVRSNRFLTRLFGCRELALAGGLAAASSPDAVSRMALLGAAVDSVDLLAGTDEARRGNLSALAIAMGPAGIVGVIALGLRVAGESRTQPGAWAA